MIIRYLPLLLPLVLVLPAHAQRDTVRLVDGTTKSRVIVLDYTFKELSFKERRVESTLPREQILSVKLGQTRIKKALKDAHKSVTDEDWGTAFQRYMKAADGFAKDKRMQPFAQFAYWEAFQIALKHEGSKEDLAEALAGIQKDEDSAFLPNIWEYRIRVSRQKAGKDRKRIEAHKKLVAQYRDFIDEQGLAERYKCEADLYAIDASAALKEIDAKKLQDRLTRLLPRVEGSYPDLANRVNLEFAYAVLAEGKLADARKLFSEIEASAVADDTTKARALVGRAHVWLRTGRDAENGKKALMDFMRVPILYPDADIEAIGEALYYAMQAYRQWNGPDARANITRLRSRLKLRYGDSTWAKK